MIKITFWFQVKWAVKLLKLKFWHFPDAMLCVISETDNFDFLLSHTLFCFKKKAMRWIFKNLSVQVIWKFPAEGFEFLEIKEANLIFSSP